MYRSFYYSLGKICLQATLIFTLATAVHGQTFMRVTDGDVANDVDNSIGSAWVDVDGDGDLDLFVPNISIVNPSNLYRNDGHGSFSRVEGDILLDDPHFSFGTCWADIDNDGDLDVANAGAPNSALYTNDGLGTFTKIESGDFGNSVTRGWSCAWGDYNNDGHVDLFIAHPAGFVGVPVPNSLFKNNGDGTFESVLDSPIVTGLAPYTVGNWIDYDDDGDIDLFIGSGPANGTQAPDFLYRNELVETGEATFTRITDLPLNEARDGQTWNFIDYDNDGDRDAYVTNYSGGVPSGVSNDLYRNDGGTFVKVTDDPLATDNGFSLANVWGDFDNDGDLDVVVTNEFGQDNIYYENSGAPDYSFTPTTDLASTATGTYGATAGDFDLDGDLDLFIQSYSGGQRHFYETRSSITNHWVNILLEGVMSNRAGVGAKVYAEVNLNGSIVVLQREVSTQNTFNGHNSLNVHFGLGDAQKIEKLTIVWPSGLIDVVDHVKANAFYVAIEGKHVVRASEFLVHRLNERISALESSGIINNGQSKSLKAKLEVVLQHINAGRYTAAINVIGSFSNQVRALENAGILVDDQVSSLTDPSITIRTLLIGDDANAHQLVEQAENIVPPVSIAGMALDQNHPNPFNPTTTIGYSLSTPTRVSLSVFDVQGRLVARLVEGFQKEGRHEVRWDASQLPSGMYIYRIEADGSVQTRMMQLIK